MSIESPADLNGIRTAGVVVRSILNKLKSEVRPGMTTMDIDVMVGEELVKAGALAVPKKYMNFPGNMCISVNEQVVHCTPSARPIFPKDLVKLDLAAEINGYIADAAITIAMEDAPDEARHMRDCSLAALKLGIEAAKPGNFVHAISKAIFQEVKRSGFLVVRGYAGHGTGRKLWEEPSIPNDPKLCDLTVLRDGMVLAIEPIIAKCENVCVDGWNVITMDGSLSAHYEHTVIVRKTGGEILT